jgi:hypothetical protein
MKWMDKGHRVDTDMDGDDRWIWTAGYFAVGTVDDGDNWISSNCRRGIVSGFEADWSL